MRIIEGCFCERVISQSSIQSLFSLFSIVFYPHRSKVVLVKAISSVPNNLTVVAFRNTLPIEDDLIKNTTNLFT